MYDQRFTQTHVNSKYFCWFASDLRLCSNMTNKNRLPLRKEGKVAAMWRTFPPRASLPQDIMGEMWAQTEG